MIILLKREPDAAFNRCLALVPGSLA